MSDTRCPDCGSHKVKHNPLPDTDFICGDCGKWFDKYPDKITVNDIVNGCQCAIANIAGEDTVLRCVTCPIHGDKEFKKGE